jgi:hypothetical protein
MPTKKSNPPRPRGSNKEVKNIVPPTADETRAIVLNNLRASPDFAIICREYARSLAANPNDPKMLAADYKKNILSAFAPRTKTTMSKTKTCAHIKVTGVRCGSPALREAEFCYFHQRMLRTVKGPKSRIHPIALLENEAAIQSSVMEVVNGLIRGTIELKRAELILRALNIATRNSRRVQFGLQNSDMVTRIPDYTEPEDPTPTVAEMYAKALATAAQQVAPSANAETATPPATAATPATASPIIANGGADASSAHAAQTHRAAAAPSTKQPAAIDPTQRKQPMSVKETPRPAKEAPKERKIAAHRASGG